MRERAVEAEERLVAPFEHPELELRRLAHHLGELARVGRVANGAGGHGLDARGAELAGERRHANDGLGSALHRRLRQLAAGVHAGAEPRSRLHLIDDPDVAVGRHVGDDRADRVGADVDRGDAIEPCGGVRPLRRQCFPPSGV